MIFLLNEEENSFQSGFEGRMRKEAADAEQVCSVVALEVDALVLENVLQAYWCLIGFYTVA